VEELVKLVVFIPEQHEGALRHALADAGAGAIGNYDHVFFVTSGRWFFRPLPVADPHIGEVGAVSEVRECRAETVCPVSGPEPVLRSMRQVHPYEEVAFDVYPLINHRL
jgi:hypothetical protein